jgi:hypothetical protein
MHRRPPQMPGCPPLIGQSALESHGPAAALLQVSHAHFSPAAPLQFGLPDVIALLTVPVELLRSIGRVAITLAVVGGQSRLVAPKSGRPGTMPLASHDLPARMPSEHVPPRTLSLIVPSPTQVGHGVSVDGLLWTREKRFAMVTASPVSTFAVPVTAPLNWLRTQVPTPPATSGKGPPKKN